MVYWTILNMGESVAYEGVHISKIKPIERCSTEKMNKKGDKVM